MKKVFYVITDLDFGGTEKMLYETVTRIDRDRFSPRVCSLKREGGLYYNKLHAAGIGIMSLGTGGYGGVLFPAAMAAAVIRLAHLIRESGADIVHTYLFQANILGGLAARLAGVNTVISSIRGMETGLQFMLEKLVTSGNDRIIVNSDALRRIVTEKAHIPADRISVVYNGVEVPKGGTGKPGGEILAELGAGARGPVAGYIGRLHEEKGVDVLLSAVASVAGKHPGFKLLVIGDGPYRMELEKMSLSLGISGQVVFAGAREDVTDIIPVLDILVLSSPWEGLPNVIMEAMVSGTAVVATAAGGVKELITDGETGLLAEPGDASGISSALLRMIEDRDKRVSMEEKARKHVMSAFSMDKMISETEKIYMEAAG